MLILILLTGGAISALAAVAWYRTARGVEGAAVPAGHLLPEVAHPYRALAAGAPELTIREAPAPREELTAAEALSAAKRAQEAKALDYRRRRDLGLKNREVREALAASLAEIRAAVAEGKTSVAPAVDLLDDKTPERDAWLDAMKERGYRVVRKTRNGVQFFAGWTWEPEPFNQAGQP
jgi:hypothetical protein